MERNVLSMMAPICRAVTEPSTTLHEIVLRLVLELYDEALSVPSFIRTLKLALRTPRAALWSHALPHPDIWSL